LRWYGRHPEVIKEKLDGMLSQVYCAECLDGDYTALRDAQKIRYAAKRSDRLPPAYHQLQRFQRQLEAKAVVKASDLDDELQLVLMRPRTGISAEDRAVIWQLLCRIQPLDVLRLYKSDKNRFFPAYQTWPESLKNWAVALLKERYLPLMNRRQSKQLKEEK
jgi:hypothetical protein